MKKLLLSTSILMVLAACSDGGTNDDSEVEDVEEVSSEEVEVDEAETEEETEDVAEDVEEEATEETESEEKSDEDTDEETETESEDTHEETSDEESDEDTAVDDESGEEEEVDYLADRAPSNETFMSFEETVTEGPATPKSIVSNGEGLLIANNMLYQHSVTLYDSETNELVKSLSDAVDLHSYGFTEYPEDTLINGSPVEAVWTSDGDYAYVSNYLVADYGGYADDACTSGSAITPGFVYRLNAETLEWDDVIQAGRVPKYVALTSDDSTLLVSNWCDHDMSIIDVESGETLHRVPLNINPRGIVILPDDKTAYVTAQWAHELYRVDIENGTSEKVMDTGIMPRHLVISPEGDIIYLTLSRDNMILKMDAETAEVLDSTYTGLEPRTTDISPDGTALYVVNYDEATVSKFDANTLEEIQREPVGYSPIGVTYDEKTGKVWVANYGGTFTVFNDLNDEMVVEEESFEGEQAEESSSFE